jgi:hypothetical protein
MCNNKRSSIWLASPMLLVAVCLLALGGASVHAQTGGGYELTWYTVDNGGGKLSGGSYVLMGTAGQPDAGGALAGGDLVLVGGFWPGVGMAQHKLYLPLVIKKV